MSRWLFPDDMEGVDPSHPIFDCIVPLRIGHKPGSKVWTPMFPDNTFIIGPDWKPELIEPHKSGDRAQLSPGEWYVMNENGKTWELDRKP